MLSRVMMRGCAAAVLAGVVAAGGDVAAQERFEIDASHSNVDFVVRHLGVANVRGTFGRFSGHIVLDEADVTRSTVEVTVDASSIDTRNERRDADLRGENFFEVERFPTLRFEGRQVERDGDGLVLVGDLTIRDVTREVRIPFELTGPVAIGENQRRLAAEGAVRVNRFDYGLRWNRITEAVQVVGNDVLIELRISAVARRDG